MIILIIILVMLSAVLGIALAVSMRSRRVEDEDRRFINKDGDHVYYNESIIEKKEFRQKFPKEEPRSFDRLFRTGGRNKN